MESSRFCRCSSYCSADSRRNHGQFRQSFQRLQRGLGKWVAEADDLEDAHQLLLPEQGQVAHGPDGAHYVDVGVVLPRQLAGGVDHRARRLQQWSEERCVGGNRRSTTEISSDTAEGNPESRRADHTRRKHHRPASCVWHRPATRPGPRSRAMPAVTGQAPRSVDCSAG